MNVTHQPIRTPNPSVWSLEVTVKASILASNPDFTPAEGTPYNSFPKWFKDSAYIKQWGLYTYVDNRDGPQRGDVTLIFCKNFTATENATPFRVTPYLADHRWPPQLLALSFIKDHAFPRAINTVLGGKGGIVTGPSYYVRRVFIPAITEGTRFVKNEFFSNTPLPIPDGGAPIPTEVMWDIPGRSGGIAECLHGDILIPYTQSANVGIVQGDQAAASGVVAGQFFPATNMETLSPYILSQSNEFQGGYYSVQLWVYPPAETPDPIIQ